MVNTETSVEGNQVVQAVSGKPDITIIRMDYAQEPLKRRNEPLRIPADFGFSVDRNIWLHYKLADLRMNYAGIYLFWLAYKHRERAAVECFRKRNTKHFYSLF